MKKLLFIAALVVAGLVNAQSLNGPKNLYWVSFCGGSPVGLLAYDMHELQWVAATYDSYYWTDCDMRWF